MLFFFLGVGGRWQQQQQKNNPRSWTKLPVFSKTVEAFCSLLLYHHRLLLRTINQSTTIPGFWVALLVHIKMSWKHFPLWCSYCLLSEAIPSEVRSNFADYWFLDAEHYEPLQLIWLEPVCTASSKKVTAGSCIFCNNAFSSILFVCIMQHGQSVNPVMQSLLALTQFL